MKASSRRRAKRVRETSPRYEHGTRLLLDTHVWLWWKGNDPKLGPRARTTIAKASEVRFSAASVWEIAIKRSSGKLEAPPHDDIVALLALAGFVPLAIEMRHVARVASLPSIHRDPFDRMLVAQAHEEGLALVTADVMLAKYGVEVVSAKE